MMKTKHVGGGGSFSKLLRGSDELRAWAEQCREQTNDGRVSGEERDHLLKMSEALLIVADNQDWLDGKKKQLNNGQREDAMTRASTGANLLQTV